MLISSVGLLDERTVFFTFEDESLRVWFFFFSLSFLSQDLVVFWVRFSPGLPDENRMEAVKASATLRSRSCASPFKSALHGRYLSVFSVASRGCLGLTTSRTDHSSPTVVVKSNAVPVDESKNISP